MNSRFPSLVLAALACAAVAHAAPGRQDLVITAPESLPADARQPGQSMALHALNNGKTYLYIEQQQRGRLVILDVSEPGHIREVGTASLALPAAFEFTGNLGFSAALVCFPGSKDTAVLSFNNPAQPVLVRFDALHGSVAQRLSPGEALLADAPPVGCGGAGRDYRVVATRNAVAPQVLATVEDVRQTVEREETGTTFLLGADGLTVLRHPAVELKYRLESSYTN